MSLRRAILRRGALGVGVDAREPRDEPPPQQRLARRALARDARVGVGAGEGALHRGVDRAFQAAERLVVRDSSAPARPYSR